MQVMAKRKKPEPADDAPKPPPRVRTGYSLNVWLDSELGEAFEELLAEIQPRTSKTAIVEMLLREHLKAKGKLPRKPRGGA